MKTARIASRFRQARRPFETGHAKKSENSMTKTTDGTIGRRIRILPEQ